MISNLRTAIYNRLLTSTYLNSGNVFFDRAPQGEFLDPYCVYSYITNPMTRDTHNVYEEQVFQLSLFGSDVSTLETIGLDLISIFKNSEAALTGDLSGNEIVAIVPQYTTLIGVESDLWNLIIRYRLFIK